MRKILKEVELGIGNKAGYIRQVLTDEGGERKMILETMYMENLPSANYKSKQFTRRIAETLPDDISKEALLTKAARQQGMVEKLVGDDIDRHLEAMKQS